MRTLRFCAWRHKYIDKNTYYNYDKIVISSGLEKPYYIKGKGMSPSGCYMRVGTSTQPMPTVLIDELYAKRIHTTLRNIPSPRQDLTFAQLKIYYQERGLELKYAGKNKVDLIENKEYGYCSLVKATNTVLDKMRIENITMAKVTGTKRIERNLVEPVPLREALINAIVHNDFSREIPPVFEIFSDRMEFTSYGGLIPGQSMEDFFSCSSMPRNRELMRVFKDVGLVEQLGSGMSRILDAYDKNVFEISEHFIKVVFPFSWMEQKEDADTKTLDGDDNGDEKKVVLLLEKMPEITAREISEKLGFSTRKISRIIKNLRESGEISRIGSDRKGRWKINK